jgi:Spy/CpxP family protein refolding chaperone
MKQKLKVVAVLVGVFLLGALAGAYFGRAYAFSHIAKMAGAPRQERAHLRAEALRHELDLDDEQTKRLETILIESDPDREKAISPCRQELDALRARTDGKIRELLRPEQQARYDAWTKRRAAARQ